MASRDMNGPSPASAAPVAFTERVGILGCGRMAEAMLARWLDSGTLAAGQVHAVVRTPERAELLRQRWGVTADLDTDGMAASCGVVLLAVKPQQLATFGGATDHASSGDAAQRTPTGALWISVLAGTPLAALRSVMGDEPTWVRAMPNTPSRIGLGASALCVDASITPAQRQTVDALFDPLGATFWLEEARIDAFTAVAGSGPAYVFAFAEALQAAAVAEGFDAEDARNLATATLHGAAVMLAKDGRPAAALRQEVVSPGGTTAAGLDVFAAGGFAELVAAGVMAARMRSQALAAEAAAVIAKR